MEFLATLWLPILVSAVAVYIVSSVVHMAFTYHRSDLAKLPNEDAVVAGLRQHNLPPGDYMFPCAGSFKDACTPEMQAKFQAGPVGLLTLLPPGPMSMGRNLFQWFVYTLVVSVFVAYVAQLAFAPGADAMAVFRMTGAVSMAIYALGAIPNSIWKGTQWSTSWKFVFDGILYGLAAGGAFAWLWP